jgi:hypothetical protein
MKDEHAEDDAEISNLLQAPIKRRECHQTKLVDTINVRVHEDADLPESRHKIEDWSCQKSGQSDHPGEHISKSQ